MKYNGTMTIEDLEETEYDYLYKIIVVGEQKVGKSNVIMRYLNDTYSSTNPT
jgi:GTPase SAR1 family protein